MSLKEIQLINVTQKYSDSPDGICALTDINLVIKQGEFVGICGKNASGKTTLARLLNGLLLPSRGKVLINGMDTRDRRYAGEIRRSVAMVFQNPENQIVSPMVEEEIAFGPENLNLSRQEIDRRVEEALDIMGLRELRLQAPHLLSGGQKQRLAVAAALAMHPDYLVLDEPTSMLDQGCRRELLDHLYTMNRKKGHTIILISHHMEDLAKADRLLVLRQGSILADAPPWAVFEREELPEGLKPPEIARIAQLLRESGFNVHREITARGEMVDELCRLSKFII